jgi:hypothetical protein
MEGQTNIGRNAVDKMEELEEIGGLQSWVKKKKKKKKIEN